jgi:hypothetical protein
VNPLNQITRFFAAVLSCGTLAGCDPSGDVMAWTKNGANTALLRADMQDCEFEGAKEIPAAIGVYSNPGYYSSNIVIAPTISSYDANASLRSQYLARCMVRKGYSLRKTKLCQGGQSDNTGCATQIN